MYKIGDTVIVVRDDGREEQRRVRAVPWQLGHGAWVIGLEGISGGYDLRRIKGKVPSIVGSMLPFQPR